MIGIFDSGIGGLSVLPDTAHLPYGDKDDAFRKMATLRHALAGGQGNEFPIAILCI